MTSSPRLVAATVLAAAATLVAAAPRASACGCFAPPNPTVAVVQAGEKILFAVDGQTITAHVQIRYQGDAAEFGWLVPLPSVPEVSVGTDELFARLSAATAPSFTLTTRTMRCGGGFTTS